jgi:hypothetical protein
MQDKQDNGTKATTTSQQNGGKANEDRRRERQSRKTYFAVVCGDGWGYILDAYPEERLNYLRELGKDVIGEFGTQEEADACVKDSLTTKQKREGTTYYANRFV